jgi:hypothetical protein
MTNDANRSLIVFIAAGFIVVMAIIIFLTWVAPGDSIETLGDLVQELDDNNDTAGRLVITLGALAFIVFSLLIIILELAPEDEERELRVKQAGSTTIVPAQALRQRLEEAIIALPEVTTVKARVWSRENAIASNLDLGLVPNANIANVTQEASRLFVDIIQTELGLPVAGLPEVRVSFGGEKPQPVPAPTLAATATQAPSSSPPMYGPGSAASAFEPVPSQPDQAAEGPGEGFVPTASDPSRIDPERASPDSSPGPLVYDPEPRGEEDGPPDGPRQ